MIIICPNCGRQSPLDTQYFDDCVYTTCLYCNYEITIVSETITTLKSQLECQEPNFEIKQLITISNEQHPWYGELGIIRAKKHLHCRIEINGKLIWLPSTWIKSYDNSNSNNYTNA